MLIALPSELPGGLDAPLSEHFGHCGAFTLVEIDDGQVNKVSVLPNAPHEQGGCMAPVMVLKNAGADALVAGGMGMRPLAGFQQVGIQVFFSENLPTVELAVDLFRTGRARAFAPAQACGGGGGAGGGGCHG